nr:MAG TPA: hypothetical protein [Crassvirales sp.]
MLAFELLILFVLISSPVKKLLRTTFVLTLLSSTLLITIASNQSMHSSTGELH